MSRLNCALQNVALSCMLLIGLGSFLLSAAGCERRAATSTDLEDAFNDEAPVQESWNVHMNVNEGAHPRLRIRAGHMARYEHGDSTYTLLHSPDSAAKRRVVVHLFDTQGDSSSTIRADRLFYYDEERRFEARGDVVATTAEQKRLETERLLWNEDMRQIRAPGFVRITTPSDRIEGYGLKGGENLQNYNIADVTGQVTLEE